MMPSMSSHLTVKIEIMSLMAAAQVGLPLELPVEQEAQQLKLPVTELPTTCKVPATASSNSNQL